MAKDRLSGKLAVILHADIAGSTALVQQDKQLAHERIQDTFQRFSTSIEKYQGHVVELRGDALLAEFERASDAVSAALSFQTDHTYHISRLKDDLRPTVRVGIAMGEVIIADSTVTGAGVVQAQRVEQLADPGGICITAAIHESLSRSLPFDLEDLGEQVLKGFDVPVRVYRVELIAGQSIPFPQQTGISETSPKKPGLLIAATLIVLLVAGAAAYWFNTQEPKVEAASIDRMAFPLPDKPSIAVLPFTNISSDAEQEYFADGITEDLITDLSKVSGLFVIARNSVFTYKGKAVKVRQVAEELGVRYVLEGSVRRVGDQVRINAQLIDATTGGHLWAERYDGSLADIFGLQDQVTKKIVDAMSVTLTPLELEGLGSTGTSNAAAYDAYLQGFSFYLRNTPEDNAKAVPHFKRAVELDPDFKRAHTALAKVYYKGIDAGDFAGEMGIYWRRAILLAYKQLAKIGDEKFADVHVIRSRMALTKHQVKVALWEAERALDLNTNDVEALKAKALALIYSGQYAEGRKIANLTLRLDPAVPADSLYMIGLAHFATGDYKESVDYIERALEHNPSTNYYAGPLAAAYGKLGMVQEAKQAYRKYLISWLKKNASIADVVFYFPFQDGEVLKHLADGFATAGARERTGGFKSRYLELDRETRLSGQEIKSLLFGHTIKGQDYWTWSDWEQKRTIDGKVSHSGYPVHTGSDSIKEGESRIEDDRVCERWLDADGKIDICALIFRDVDWGPDAYFMVTDQGPMRFKVSDK